MNGLNNQLRDRGCLDELKKHDPNKGDLCQNTNRLNIKEWGNRNIINNNHKINTNSSVDR